MEHRSMCSDLITIQLLTADGRKEEMPAILEDIDASGACIQVERPVRKSTALRLLCTNCDTECEFHGKVSECHFHAGIGYFASVEFEAGCSWSRDLYRPKHLLDLDELARRAGGEDTAPSKRRCCGGVVCPSEVICRVVAPALPLVDRICAVGREVAKVCGRLNNAEAAQCFHRLFRMPEECCLFDGFLTAYQVQREEIDAGQAVDSSPLEHVSNVVSLLNTIPEEVLGN